MKANELRVGNWVKSNASGNEFRFTSYHFNDINQILSCNPPKPLIEPIPLTEEWLVKFGFVEESKYFCYKKISDEISICFNWGKAPSGNWGLIGVEKYFIGLSQNVFIEFPQKVENVHSLQNLYFALTGEELTIK